MLTAALFTTARTWGQPECPSPEGQIKKLWHIRIMDYYSATKRNKPVAFAKMWADLETVTKVNSVRKRKM